MIDIEYRSWCLRNLGGALVLLCFESKMSAQSSTLWSLIPDLVATDRTWGRSQGVTRKPCKVGALNKSILAHKKEQDWASFWLGWVRSKRIQDHLGTQQREIQGRGREWKTNMLAAWNTEIILNKAVGFLSKEHLSWDSSVLPIYSIMREWNTE